MTHEQDVMAPAREVAAALTDPTPPDPPAATVASTTGGGHEGATFSGCAQDGCACTAPADTPWCSDACRDAQQGISQGSTCPCGHSGCITQQQ
jgi:hypothetical protein